MTAKDLENRLSDALETAARTVPEQAVPPEPRWAERRQERQRRTWAVAAVAAAAVGAAVALPSLASDDTRPGEATSSGAAVCATPPPVGQPVLTIPQQKMPRDDDPWFTDLPFGPAPKVPYALTDGPTARGFLQDGPLRVPLPPGRQFVSWGRVECGWLVSAMLAGDRFEFGVLETSGRFRSFGEANGDGASLSPDGRQVTFVRAAGSVGELVVLEVATGHQAASIPTPQDSDVLGWNGHGIWFAPLRQGTQTRLWRPGSEPIRIDTGGARLTAWRTQDRMLLTGNQPGQQASGCLRVVALAAGDKLTELMRQCITPEGSLSPDGQVLVAGSHAFHVPDNSPTAFRPGSSAFGAHHETIWEDARHFLSQVAIGADRSATVRCDAVDGDCQKVADGPDSPDVALGYR